MRMRKFQIKQVILFISFVLLMLTGCGNNTQQSETTTILPPTSVPVVNDVPSVTPTEIPITVSSTATSVPTTTSLPTPTSLPSPTPEPTATPVPIATPSPEPTATPTTAPAEKTIKIPVVISGLDKGSECVSVSNVSDKDIDLTGWYLISVTGNQRFNFPDGYIIKAGAEIKVASFEATGDLTWTTANMWNNSKSDPAELYNADNMLQSRWDD